MVSLTPRERAALAVIALLTAIAGIANYAHWAAVPRSILATVALAGLAWVVSLATGQLGERFGPGVTGILQSTLGNLPELFVVVFALQKGSWSSRRPRSSAPSSPTPCSCSAWRSRWERVARPTA